MEIPLAIIAQYVKERSISTIFLITNEERSARDVAKVAQEIGASLVVATNSKAILESLKDDRIRIKKLSDPPSRDIHILTEAEEVLVSGAVEGSIGEKERVLCVVADNIFAMVEFDIEHIGIASLRKEVEDRVDMPVLQAVLNLSVAIAREGREGRVVGCLFVLGDTDAVLKNSRQLIINPFKGHSEEERNFLNKENWETIKEFTQIDGAFIIDKKGYAVSVGRYVGVNWDIYLQGGLGGRHLAAASISKTTKAIAVTVSTSGTIRVFKDGRVIFKVNTL